VLLGALERSHPARRVAVLRVASLESSDERQVFEPRARAGRESKAWTEKALEGKNLKRAAACWRGETQTGCERTRRRERSFEVGEAGGTKRFRDKRSRANGKRLAREKGAHSRRGKPCNRVKAWKSEETGDERTRVVRFSTSVDNCKEAKLPRER
jgi:hypothetical protein